MVSGASAKAICLSSAFRGARLQTFVPGNRLDGAGAFLAESGKYISMLDAGKLPLCIHLRFRQMQDPHILGHSSAVPAEAGVIVEPNRNKTGAPTLCDILRIRGHG